MFLFKLNILNDSTKLIIKRYHRCDAHWCNALRSEEAMGAMHVFRIITCQLKKRFQLVNEHKLFLGKRNLHGISWSNFESLQGFSSSSRLNFVFEFHEGNIMTTRNQSNFFESRKSVKQTISMESIRFRVTNNCLLCEQHGQHHFISFLW